MLPVQEDGSVGARQEVRGGRWASGPLDQPPAHECVIMNPHLSLCGVESVLGRTHGE